MNKQIPFIFNCTSVSPIRQISESLPNTGRMNVAVFTKYKNRNGSYITDAFSEKLIESALSCPVVGFYDRETKDWGGHLGPTLASAYGYVENFIGWKPITDSDGITRDYAVFSVVVFSDYFEEAQYILGKSQSMEIDPETISGEWGLLDGEEYFIYTEGKMKGLCILGDSTEPCFSSSHFFEKQDKESRFDKFSSLLFELKSQVEEAEKGGETLVENFEGQAVVNEEQENIQEQQPLEEQIENFEENSPSIENIEEIPQIEETSILPTATVVEMEKYEEDFNLLTEENNQLKNTINTLNSMIEQYSTKYSELEQELISVRKETENLSASLSEAQSIISKYQAQEIKIEEEKKNALIQSYEQIIPEEEIKQVSEGASNLNYDELESKLAVMFARRNLSNHTSKVFVAEEEKSPFEALISKYKKN